MRGEEGRSAWVGMAGRHVEVVDVKKRTFMGCIGRTGTIKYDRDFNHYYLSLNDGGSANEDEVIVEEREGRDG